MRNKLQQSWDDAKPILFVLFMLSLGLGLKFFAHAQTPPGTITYQNLSNVPALIPSAIIPAMQGTTNVTVSMSNLLSQTSGTNGPSAVPTLGWGFDQFSNITLTIDGSKGWFTGLGFLTQTNPWAGPSNALNSVGCYVYDTYTSVSITGFVMMAGTTIENSCRLWIFNKSGSNITYSWVSASRDGSRSITVSNGQNAVYSGGFLVGRATNSSAYSYY